jgi:hypothetical protein
MSAILFDTHELVKTMKEAGFSERQAEVQTETAKLVYNAALGQMREEIRPHELATQKDLKHLETKLTVEIKNVKIEIEKSKNSTLRWVFGMMLAQTSFIFVFFGKALNLF